tara:strand:- start:104 stop:271 length:168 start_codon:yes stop_codon:yes gene_type:complete
MSVAISQGSLASFTHLLLLLLLVLLLLLLLSLDMASTSSLFACFILTTNFSVICV